MTTRTMSRRQRAENIRLHRGVYICADEQIDAYARARAAWLYCKGRGVLAGRSAAAVQRTRYLDADAPAELIRPRRSSGRTSGQLIVRSEDLPAEEILELRGMRVTTPTRTALDLGRTVPGDAAVVLLDALFHATGISTGAVLQVAAAHPRIKWRSRLMQVLPKVDGGSESPQETYTRLLIIRSGLPAPQTQIPVFEAGRQFARLDMGWPQWKVAVEYDGAWHWEQKGQRSQDVVRHERLTSLGWRVVRVTAGQLRGGREVVARIRTQLRAAGAPV